MRTPVVPDV
uniref:Uncharacterized protein n=1 Tax=Anguilla anguilla TaxID=7936 RepID=A0A0E9THF4_ANGAN